MLNWMKQLVGKNKPIQQVQESTISLERVLQGLDTQKGMPAAVRVHALKSLLVLAQKEIYNLKSARRVKMVNDVLQSFEIDFPNAASMLTTEERAALCRIRDRVAVRLAELNG